MVHSQSYAPQLSLKVAITSGPRLGGSSQGSSTLNAVLKVPEQWVVPLQIGELKFFTSEFWSDAPGTR